MLPAVAEARELRDVVVPDAVGDRREQEVIPLEQPRNRRRHLAFLLCAVRTNFGRLLHREDGTAASIRNILKRPATPYTPCTPCTPCTLVETP